MAKVSLDNPVRMGLGDGNPYVDLSKWALRQVIERHPEMVADGAVLDRRSIASRHGSLIFKQGRGTTKEGRRFEYSCILKVNSASEEDVTKLSVANSWACIWWIPDPLVNTELLILVAAAGVSEEDWSILSDLAEGKYSWR